MKEDSLIVMISVFVFAFVDTLLDGLSKNMTGIVEILAKSFVAGVVQLILSRYFFKHEIQKLKEIYLKEVQTIKEDFISELKNYKRKKIKDL